MVSINDFCHEFENLGWEKVEVTSGICCFDLCQKEYRYSIEVTVKNYSDSFRLMIVALCYNHQLDLAMRKITGKKELSFAVGKVISNTKYNIHDLFSVKNCISEVIAAIISVDGEKNLQALITTVPKRPLLKQYAHLSLLVLAKEKDVLGSYISSFEGRFLSPVKIEMVERAYELASE